MRLYGRHALILYFLIPTWPNSLGMDGILYWFTTMESYMSSILVFLPYFSYEADSIPIRSKSPKPTSQEKEKVLKMDQMGWFLDALQIYLFSVPILCLVESIGYKKKLD